MELARSGGQAAVERHLLDGFIPVTHASLPAGTPHASAETAPAAQS